MSVTIFTFDGTGSQVPTNFEISESPLYNDPNPALTLAQRYLGGGFPANVARRLLAHDSATWKWYPVDYKSGFRLFNPFAPSATYDIPLRNGSIGRALGMLGGALQKTPGKIALCGLSQGAWICDLAWEEFSNPSGLFHDRLSDLVAIVTFGSPRRPYGLTPDLPGAIKPAGQGVADFPHQMSFGTVPGLVADPPEFMQAYCMINDAASDSSTVEPTRSAAAALAEYFFDGDIEDGMRLLSKFADIVIDIGGTITWDMLKPDGDSPFALSKWLPFTAGAAGGDARILNPHAQYNSFAYDALVTAPLLPSLQYVGSYNAVTNTPALSDSTGTNGQVYRVSVGGTRNFGSGSISLNPFDFIIRSAGTWQKAALNSSGGSAIWTPLGQTASLLGTKLSAPGGKTAVDLAVDYLIGIGNQYASEPAAPERPQLGFTWWQTPPDAA